jgi:transcriptional regulator with XRE-family HTH domain
MGKGEMMMAVRKPPTERQRRIGAELRRMREHAGLSINDAAVLHDTDRTTVSNTESARSGVRSDRVRVWAANYSCPDAEYVDALAAMAKARGVCWRNQYRGQLAAQLLDIAEMEHYAVALRFAQIVHMPGLLSASGLHARGVPGGCATYDGRSAGPSPRPRRRRSTPSSVSRSTASP